MKTSFAQYTTRSLLAALISFAIPSVVWGERWELITGQTDKKQGDTEGFFRNITGTEGFINYEAPDRLLDGYESSKWCSSSDKRENGIWKIVFEAKEAFYPVKYVLITGHDNSRYRGRNPKTWGIRAKEDNGQLTMDNVQWSTTNNGYDVIAYEKDNYTMENKDFNEYVFDVKREKIGLYKYFNFWINENQGADCMQLSELQFYGVRASNVDYLQYSIITGLDNIYVASITQENVLAAVKSAVNVYKVTAPTTPLTEGTDYTISVSQKQGSTWTVTFEANTNSSACNGSCTEEITVQQATELTTGADWTNSVYSVTNDITFDKRIEIKGNVALYFENGATLTAKEGISVTDGNSLTINGSGAIKAAEDRNNRLSGAAGIGGNLGETCGTVIINGGTIVSYGYNNGAGIGGGAGGGAGTITINGGTITAQGANLGAGIGGGGGDQTAGDGGTITINGGTITATPGASNDGTYSYAYGIGAGKTTSDHGTFGTIALNGTNNPVSITTESFGGKVASFGEGRNITIKKEEGDRLDSKSDIQLDGRTLYKDGSWNTLCLPFDLTAAQVTAQLAPTALMELDIEGTYDADGNAVVPEASASGLHQTGFDPQTGTLYLYFKTATTITAGKPYIIKWNNADNNIVNPTFENVSVNSNTCNITKKVKATTTTSKGEVYINFIGTFSPVTLTAGDKTALYLGAGNTLYYPSSDVNMGAFRAYFALDGIFAGERIAPNNDLVKSFIVSMDNEQWTMDNDPATGIDSMENGQWKMDNEAAAWYDLSGRKIVNRTRYALGSSKKLSNCKLPKGFYIVNGKKVAIK